MTKPINKKIRTKEEVIEDLSTNRVPADTSLRRCIDCGRVLSIYNKSRDKCFFHSLSVSEQAARKNAPVGVDILSSESRAKEGFKYVSIQYHGSAKDL